MDLFRNIFLRKHKSVPDEVRKSLNTHFEGCSGIEWSLHEDRYEALFFHDGIEKIARFDKAGRLTEYRVNIFPDVIPSPIREAVSSEYEIMNCIAIYTTDKLTYELIIRDAGLIRFNLILDSLGNRTGLSVL